MLVHMAWTQLGAQLQATFPPRITKESTKEHFQRDLANER